MHHPKSEFRRYGCARKEVSVDSFSTDVETVRVLALQRRESDLLGKLEQCIPPVDQHRADLERVRSELSEARRSGR